MTSPMNMHRPYKAMELCLLLLMLHPFANAQVTKTNNTDALVDNATMNRTVSFASGVDFPSGALITDVNVTVTFQRLDNGGSGCVHNSGNPWNSDIAYSVISPSGTTILLTQGFPSPTFNSNTYGGTVTMTFDQAAGTAVNTIGYPQSGSYQPHGGSLNTLNGETPFGTWTVRHVDPFGGFGVTCHVSASVTVSASVPCTGPSISSHPSPTTICELGMTGFSVSATGTPTLNYQWEMNSGMGWSNVSGGVYSGQTSASLSLLFPDASYDGRQYRCVVTNGCGSATSNAALSTVHASGSWLGTVSDDWGTAGNWCGGVPTAGSNVNIRAAAPNQPNLGANATVNNLTVENGATLVVEAGNHLSVNGSTVNNGTLRVEASASAIGSFINSGGISGIGSFQMQQYLEGAGGATPSGLFFYVSSPLANATASVYGIASGNKLWEADETTLSYPQIMNGGTALDVGQGYVARMGGNTTVTLTGNSFNTGNINITGLTRTGTTSSNRGYNLVGNPYPSTVNWNTADKTNLETSIWFRTHNGSTMLFDTYNTTGNVGTNNNGGGNVTSLIPPTQAFWVRVNGDGNTGGLFFDIADRSHQTWGSIYKQEAEEGTVRIALSNGTVSDETVVYFNAAADDARDDFDSGKMWAASDVPQLYTVVGGDSLVINGLFSTETSPVVDLGVKLPTSGSYTLHANNITFTTESVHLEDRHLSIFQDLNAEPSYSFSSDAGNIGDRFALHFGMAAVGIGGDAMHGVSTAHVFAADGMVNVTVGNDITTGMITILDMMGRTVQTASINGTRTVIPTDLTTGIYLVRVETAKGAETHRVLLR